jgi:hypothetical protein
MNRTIKGATVERYFYDTHNQLKAHLADFLRAEDSRRSKASRATNISASRLFLLGYDYICIILQIRHYDSEPGNSHLNVKV